MSGRGAIDLFNALPMPRRRVAARLDNEVGSSWNSDENISLTSPYTWVWKQIIFEGKVWSWPTTLCRCAFGIFASDEVIHSFKRGTWRSSSTFIPWMVTSVTWPLQTVLRTHLVESCSPCLPNMPRISSCASFKNAANDITHQKHFP